MYLKRLIHKMVRVTGYDFKRYIPESFVELRRKHLLDVEAIDLVVDVGAHEGFYVEQLRDAGYQGRVISFEPIKETFALLQNRAGHDANWRCFNSAVGAIEEQKTILLSEHRTSSSLLKINDTHINALPSGTVVGAEQVDVLPLDSLLGKEIRSTDRLYLKVDVQGYEKFVLEGASKVLPQVRVLEIELSFVPLYEGGPVFREMLPMLEDLGFCLVSLSEVFSAPNTSQLLQVDGLFRKRV